MRIWSVSKKPSFAYLKDRLFLCCVFLYLANLIIVKPVTLGKVAFFHCYFNDLLCIPFWLPIVLWVTRLVRLRTCDTPPAWYEILFYLLIWSYVFEIAGPAYGEYFNCPVRDYYDIVWYALGGCIAGIYWNFRLTPSVDKTT